MQNSCFFKIGWQADFGVDTARSQWRVYDVLIVRRQNDDRFLIILADSDMSVVFRESRNGSVTIGEELIEKRLAYWRQLFEFIQLHDGRDAGSRQIVIGLKDFAEVQELFAPLLPPCFLKCQLLCR